MRGKPRPACIGGFRRGITPADAGKTSRRRGELQASKDHPRGCGENSECRCRAVCGVGSPPRMRGKPAFTTASIAAIRITPADAGKTISLSRAVFRIWDHPRGCGENYISTTKSSRYLGSPPRMRGKPVHPDDSRDCARITPADAGKTQRGHFFQRSFQDHPRGCGENIKIGVIARRKVGSPPRMRGKLSVITRTMISAGITPADAGKTTAKIVALHNN